MTETYVVTLFPGSSGTEAETNEGGPCATLEEKNGEDDTERGTEGRADEHGAEAVVPLGGQGQYGEVQGRPSRLGSHAFSLSRASLMGLLERREAGAWGAEGAVESDIARVGG